MAKQKRSTPVDPVTDERLEQAYAQALRSYSQRENLTAIDKGYKYSEGERTGVVSIRFHINEKIGLENLAPAEVFPRDIQGVPTDVIEATYTAHATAVEPAITREQVMDRRRRFDTIQPGISVAHTNVTAGTLGAIVFDNNSGKPCLLSNWHVLVGDNTAQPGDAIVQPGPRDGGQAPRDIVATLERSILGPEGDAAVALLTDVRPFAFTQFETDAAINDVRLPKLGEVLEKSGRTTGVTRARVDGVGRFFITYSVGRVGVDGFKLVPIIADNPDDEEISSGGDSGSIWYSSDTGEGVGLHFGGEIDPNPKAENALACNLTTVLRELDVTLTQPDTVVNPLAVTALPSTPSRHPNGLTNGATNGRLGTLKEADRVSHNIDESLSLASGYDGFDTFDVTIRIRIRPKATAGE